MSQFSLRTVALLILIASSAQAQELAGNFDQLRVLAKPGETLTVTDSAGQRIREKLKFLSPSSMTAADTMDFQGVHGGTDETYAVSERHSSNVMIPPKPKARLPIKSAAFLF